MVTLLNKSYQEATAYINSNYSDGVSLVYTDLCNCDCINEVIPDYLSLLDLSSVLLIITDTNIEISNDYLVSSYPVSYVYPERFDYALFDIRINIFSKSKNAFPYLNKVYYFDDKERIISVKQKPQRFYRDVVHLFSKKTDTVVDCSFDRGSLTRQILEMHRDCISFKDDNLNYRLTSNYISQFMFDNKQFSLNYYPFFKISKNNCLNHCSVC